MEDMSYEDTDARILDIPIGTVMSRLSWAHRLRALMERTPAPRSLFTARRHSVQQRALSRPHCAASNDDAPKQQHDHGHTTPLLRPAQQKRTTRWHALVDGQLPADDAAALHEQLQGDQSAMDTIAHWQTQRDRLHTLHQVLYGPLCRTPWLLRHRATGRRNPANAVVALGRRRCVGGGGICAWLDRAQPIFMGPLKHSLAMPRCSPRVSAPVQRFAQQASVAHAVYQPEVRHPVEVTAAQQDHLVQWLSKRLNRPLKVPALGAQGYELVGGRLLPGELGARAQFMYQNGTGQRITLYLGALTCCDS